MKPSTISWFFCILLVVILYRYFTYYHNESDDVLKYKRVVYDYRNVTKVMAAGNHVGDELRSVQSAQVGLPSAIIPPKKNMTLSTTKLEKSVNTNKQGKTVQYNQNTNSTEDPNVKVKPLNKVSSLKTTRPATPSKSSKVFAIGPDCSDQQWCTVKIPQNSHFRFDPPTDTSRWRRAQIQAANGEQVLLQRILKLFPQILDFLDGDLLFRQYHKISDVFLDNKGRSFEALTASSKSSEYATKESMHLFKNGLPGPYDFRWAGRAPIVKLGYLAFDKSGSFLFNGKVIGEGHLGRDALLQQWKLYRSDIDTPFIALHSSNENWGLLSTHFPNRTENLGWCCSPQDLAAISDMLDDSKLLMMLVNQHTNVTHPKLLTLPRGLPIYKENQKQLIWDSMRSVLHTTKKSVLVSTSGAQNKASREQVISCVAKKFSRSDATSSFKVDVGSVEQQQQQQLTANEYLKSLGAARFSLALPGQGYDTFRLWEAMTMGSIAIIEKGVGLERTVWRLPTLVVEDFDAVTPDLLRSAYVEALYLADEFEYQRLTQSWWLSFIASVSTSNSSQPLFDAFPAQSQDSNFVRPLVPFSCGFGGKYCGPGTKSTPTSSC